VGRLPAAYRLSSTAGRHVRTRHGFYQLLHTMGVFGPQAPSTIRAFGTIGQLSPAQLIDRYAITCAQFRDLLVAYLRAPTGARSHDTAGTWPSILGCLFCGISKRHPLGIVAASCSRGRRSWKQRMLTRRDTLPRERADDRSARTASRWPGRPGSSSLRSISTSPSGRWRIRRAGPCGPHRVPSAQKTWRGRRSFVLASRAWTSGPGTDSLSCRSSCSGERRAEPRRPHACKRAGHAPEARSRLTATMYRAETSPTTARRGTWVNDPTPA